MYLTSLCIFSFTEASNNYFLKLIFEKCLRSCMCFNIFALDIVSFPVFSIKLVFSVSGTTCLLYMHSLPL